MTKSTIHVARWRPSLANRTKNKRNSVSDLVRNASQLLTSSTSPVESIGRVADLLSESTTAEAVQISAITSDLERIVEVYSRGNLSELFPSGLRRPAHGSSIRTITTRGPLLFAKEELLEISHHGVEDFAIALSAGHNVLAAAPIRLHGTNLGVVQLYSPTTLSDTTLDALSQVVPLVAPYLALYLSNIESATEDRISLSIERVAEAVIEENDINGVCDAVVRFAKSSMGIDAAILRIKNSATENLDIEYKHGHLDPEEIAGKWFVEVEKHLIPMAAETKSPLIIDEGSPEVFNERSVLQLLEEIPSLLITPLMDRDELIGTIEFYSLNEYAYKAEQLRNVDHVANLLTSAVEQFRLIRSLSREAEIRSLLAEVARLASAADDLNSLVTSISPELNKVIPVERITYTLPASRFSLASTPVQNKTQEQKDSIFTSKDGLAQISVTDSGIDMCNGEQLCGADYCVAAKLWDSAEGRSEGWIHLQRSNAPFTIEEKRLVPEFARHVSPAIDTALSHEAELRLAQEKLRAEKAEAEVENQQKLNEAKQHFIATMSHELRTPLTSIRAFGDLLNREAAKMTERQAKQIAVIRRNSEWLNILINDLLDLSSIDSGRFELQYEEVEVTSLINGLVESFGPLAEAAGHTLRAILPGRPVNILLDPSRLSQVIGNLLTNAMKYSPEGTPIRLLARCNSNGLSVLIRDEGPGIPEEQRDIIFERFGRAQSDASKMAKGTGIGLYVSKMIVEEHGGRIGVTSKLKSHTTLHFWIPAEQPEGTEILRRASSRRAA